MFIASTAASRRTEALSRSNVVSDAIAPASAIAPAPLPSRRFEALRSFRLQTALTFGGLAVVFCGAVALALGALLDSEIRRDSGHSLDAVAQAAARALESGLSQRLLETRVLAESPTLWAAGLDSPAVGQALARSQAAQPFSAWIGVADASGKVLSATSGLLMGQSVAKRPWFNEGLSGVHVGDVHRAELLERLLPKSTSGEPIRFVDFAAPIKVDGKVVGVLGMHGAWSWSREVIASLMPTDAAARGLDVFIFDRTGKVLYSPIYTPTDSTNGLHDATGWSLGALSPVPRSIDDGEHTAAVVRWPDGADYLTTIAPLPTRSAVTDMGWQIVAREPAANASARAHRAAWQVFGIGLLMASLAGVLAWFASGVIGSPLKSLARAAHDIRNHVPGADIPVLLANHELQSLSTALGGMTRRLDATYRAAPVGMCQTSLDGRIFSANERLAEILGISVDALPTLRLTDLAVEIDRFALRDDLRQLAQHGVKPPTRELSFIRNLPGQGQGQPVQTALSVSLVPTMDGEAPYLIIVVEDITQRKAAEAADRANIAKTAFLSQVSHELRTPLHAVIGFSQLMLLDGQRELSDKQRGRVDAIADAGKHLMAMIDDLLDLTQIESNRMTMSLEPVLLAGVVDQAEALVAEMARAANVELHVTPSAWALEAHVTADQVRLRQVLMNLLSNAVKYNRTGGNVNVTWGASLDGKGVELTVADTGRGMRPDKLAELFQPFNRLGAEQTGVQGTGIGLVITRKLVEMMHGTIRVTSTPDVGSQFRITLPLAAPPVFQSSGVGTLTDFSLLDEPTGELRTVMYVEDNEVNVELFVSAIELRPTFKVVIARNGEEAVRLSAENPPDVFLLDMHLGDMTGLDLAAQLKRLPQCAQIPMIALSADAAPAALETATRAGFVGYLTKPLNLRKLFDSLESAASSRSQPA